MIEKILLGSAIGISLIAILIFRPVPIVTEDKAIAETGIVTHIYEGGVKDAVFRIKDNKRRFYINRGLENGLNLKELKEKLLGQVVTLKYPKYWTPLDWDDEIKHLSKLEVEGEVLFNELKPARNAQIGFN